MALTPPPPGAWGLLRAPARAGTAVHMLSAKHAGGGTEQNITEKRGLSTPPFCLWGTSVLCRGGWGAEKHFASATHPP